MSDDHHEQSLPHGLLLGAAALVAFALLAVALQPPPAREDAMVARAVPGASLRFTDRADGAILVHDAATDRALTTIEPGSGGFVRASLRALSRERKRSRIPADTPFELRRFADGRLLLIDTSNGRIVDLAAFGPTNSGAFAALLVSAESSQ